MGSFGVWFLVLGGVQVASVASWLQQAEDRLKALAVTAVDGEGFRSSRIINNG